MKVRLPRFCTLLFTRRIAVHHRPFQYIQEVYRLKKMMIHVKKTKSTRLHENNILLILLLVSEKLRDIDFFMATTVLWIRTQSQYTSKTEKLQ